MRVPFSFSNVCFCSLPCGIVLPLAAYEGDRERGGKYSPEPDADWSWRHGALTLQDLPRTYAHCLPTKLGHRQTEIIYFFCSCTLLNILFKVPYVKYINYMHNRYSFPESLFFYLDIFKINKTHFAKFCIFYHVFYVYFTVFCYYFSRTPYPHWKQ